MKPQDVTSRPGWTRITLGGQIGDPRNGAVLAFFQGTGKMLKIMFSDGDGWDHVSVSLDTRVPTWEEMCWVKDRFFYDHEVAVQYHPARESYVNDHPFCLHLWRPQDQAMPMPPLYMV